MTKTWFGYLFALAYIFVTAVSMLFIHETNKSVPIFVSTTWIFSFTFLWFFCVNFFSLKRIGRCIVDYPITLIKINLSSLVIWMTTFFSLKFISPVLFVAIFMSMIPCATYAIKLIQKKATHSTAQSLLIILLIVLTLLLTLISHDSDHMSIHDYIWGTVIAYIGGAAVSVYFLQTSALQEEADLKAKQILLLRFPLMIVLTFILANKTSLINIVHHEMFFHLLLLSFITVIIPLYFLQKSIRRIGPVKTSYLIPLTPLVTFTIEAFMLPGPIPILEPVLLLVLAGLLIYGATLKH